MSELTIDVVSDVVCPWCFIGKRRLEAALRELKNERPDVAPRIRWLPFFLNPDTLEAGEPYRPFLERKFGGPEKLAQIWTQISEAGRTAGIDFAFERIETRANTLKAHRLIHRAQARGEADALVERLFAAQFLHGENVGDAAVRRARFFLRRGRRKACGASSIVGAGDQLVELEPAAAVERRSGAGNPAAGGPSRSSCP
jgi:predicted DsbA family dithiol-disulfide isomerase